MMKRIGSDKAVSRRDMISGMGAGLGAGALMVGAPSLALAQSAQAVPPAPVEKPETWKPFAAFLREFRAVALKDGISARTYDTAMAGLVPNARVEELNASQPEFTRNIWDYLDSAVSDSRIANGQEKKQTEAATLARAEAAYKVDRHVLLAIWGLETSYGQIMGGFNVFQALATLAYAGRRQDFGRSQLLAALRIVEAGHKDPERMQGSWAGAMGHTQFIPTTFLEFAVDGDGDGRRDLWDSMDDVFHSTANYLSRFGWETGEPWGEEVVVPQGFDFGLSGYGATKTVAQWQALGVAPATGSTRAAADKPAYLLVPAGHRGPGFLVYKNFRVIMRYNNATSYALAVAHLSDRIRGGAAFKGTWPRDVRPLSLDERKELQTLLNRLGFEAGPVDGIVGGGTRSAIRAFQASIGVPADGFATPELLTQLRQASQGR